MPACVGAVAAACAPDGRRRAHEVMCGRRDEARDGGIGRNRYFSNGGDDTSLLLDGGTHAHVLSATLTSLLSLARPGKHTRYQRILVTPTPDANRQVEVVGRVGGARDRR